MSFVTNFSKQATNPNIPKPRPNYSNAVTVKRQQWKKILMEDISTFDGDSEIYSKAMDIVRQREPEVKRYVTLKGEQPSDNIIDLSIQAIKLRNDDIEKMQKMMSCNRRDAETYIDEKDSEENTEDNFAGEIIDAIGTVANKGLQKAVAARTAKGKKPGILGFLEELTRPSNTMQLQNAAQDISQGTSLGDKIRIGADEILAGIRERESKTQLNKILPIAIIGIIVLILITIFITRSASK